MANQRLVEYVIKLPPAPMVATKSGKLNVGKTKTKDSGCNSAALRSGLPTSINQ
jgi:hypothetical protein